MSKYSTRRIVVALAAFMAIVGAACFSVSAKEGEKASITFADKIHDFGNVKENGGPVSCEFEFENTGGANLVVISATAECGCTTPDFPKQPIAPGKKGKIKVTYNPLGRPGGFDKVVTVKTNGKPAKVRLKVRGSVIPKQ